MKTSLLASRIAYLCILIFSIVFTQGVRSGLSTFFLIFVILMPVFTLLYALVTKIFLRYCVDLENHHSDAASGSYAYRVFRGDRVRVSCLLENTSFLPIFYIEAHVVYPDKDVISVTQKTRELTLLPFCKAHTSEDITFTHRGNYRIGIEHVVIYDLLRLFRLKIPASSSLEIEVMPQCGSLDIFEFQTAAISGDSSGSTKADTERTELFGVRSFLPGDSLKNIHWKLTGKNSSDDPDPYVKIYSGSDHRLRFILCDLSVSPELLCSPDDIAKQSCILSQNELHTLGDAVVEAAVAAAYSAYRSGLSCTVKWFDIMKDEIFIKDINSYNDFRAFYHMIAQAPVYLKGDSSFRFERMISECISLPDACEIYPIITSLDSGILSSFGNAHGAKNALYPMLINGMYSNAERDKTIMHEIRVPYIALPAEKPFFSYEDLKGNL
ncbi:MAG: DUF58 domain-containing protein [Ruminococcaceae bacterium]|nr:DUF58 domain-containing protein [Oscillospiraceae bacterium]